jgi:hypothetical protein
VRFAGFVNHRVFERKWRSRVRSRACLFECQQPCSSAAGAGACACAPHALLRREKPRFLRKALGVRYSGARASCLSQTACVRAQLLAGCRRVGYQAFRRGGMHFACRAPRVLFPNLCMRWARWRAGLLLLCVWHAPCASLPARASPARRNQPTSLRGQKACAGWCAHARSRACVCPRPSWVAMRCVRVRTTVARDPSSAACGTAQRVAIHSRPASQAGSISIMIPKCCCCCLPRLHACLFIATTCRVCCALCTCSASTVHRSRESAVASCARVRVTRARARWLLRRDSPGTPQVTLAGVGRSSPAPRRSAARDQAHQWTRPGGSRYLRSRCRSGDGCRDEYPIVAYARW